MGKRIWVLSNPYLDPFLGEGSRCDPDPLGPNFEDPYPSKRIWVHGSEAGPRPTTIPSGEEDASKIVKMVVVVKIMTMVMMMTLDEDNISDDDEDRQQRQCW